MAFPIILTGGQITVNKSPMTAVDLICPAWGTHDEGFSELLLGPDTVGTNIRMLGEPDWPQRKAPVTTRRQFPLFVVGECDHDEVPYDNAAAGVWSNIAYLRTHVFDQPAATDRPDGTREVTLTTPGGDEVEARCQFGQPKISEQIPTGWFLVVEVDIIEGAFFEVVS